MVTREDAQKVVDDHVANDSLKKHLLAVETCMRAFARKEGEDEEEWGIAGLVHDFDWEVCPTPDSHPTFGADILRERGFPEEIVRAVLSHGNHTGIPRETLMEKALFACDELSGFVTAVALVRPTKRPVRHQAPVGQEEDEGQGVREVGEPRRHADGGRGAGGELRRAHRLRYRRTEACSVRAGTEPLEALRICLLAEGPEVSRLPFGVRVPAGRQGDMVGA